jgi:hypothetical protein
MERGVEAGDLRSRPDRPPNLIEGSESCRLVKWCKLYQLA